MNNGLRYLKGFWASCIIAACTISMPYVLFAGDASIGSESVQPTDEKEKSASIRGKIFDHSTAECSGCLKPQPNTERALVVKTPSEVKIAQSATGQKAELLCRPDQKLQYAPMRITIDGVSLDAEKAGRGEADLQRCVDVALEKADIRINYDPLIVRPALNVWTTPNAAEKGAKVRFFTYSNYALWVRKAEVRIFEKGKTSQQVPIAVIPVNINEKTVWTTPAGTPETVYFLLRVYDEKGRFDETAAKELKFIGNRIPMKDEESYDREALVGYGENSLVVSNIPVRGGTVTIDGKKVPKGYKVRALGLPVPIDKEGRFAVRQILPAGPHSIEVSMKDIQDNGASFRRNISIPDSDFFFVGLIDLTAGYRSTAGTANAVTVTQDSDNYSKKEYIDGRGAFYLKGKIKGEYIITASADTREQPVQNLFRNLDSKDPQYLLRNIDPNRYYPVYGDDSTITDDAPTQGKFYVKLEKGDSYVMWGNFKTQWTGTELTQYSRGLYGANIMIKPDSATSFGERTTQINAFAAEPGTIASREEFRGTGGSLYYMRNMDITQGSERVWVEIRDKDSGFAIERHQLAPAQDYEINYLQGRIVLRAPLPSTADGSTLVMTSTLNGNPVYMVVTYEYVPGMTAFSDLAYGLRGTQWVGDHIRLGLTGYKQGEDAARQRLYGTDLMLRYKPGTWVKGEFARSEGPGTTTLTSITGGFDFNQQMGRDGKADAYRIEGAADLSEMLKGQKGRLTGYWQNREAGFSAPGQVAFSNEATQQIGGSAQVAVTKTTMLTAKVDRRDSTSQTYNAGELNVKQQITDEISVSVGARSDERTTRIANASPLLSDNGARTDAVVRVDYRPVVKKTETLNKGVQVNVSKASSEQTVAANNKGKADGHKTGEAKTETKSSQPQDSGKAEIKQKEGDAKKVADIKTSDIVYAPWNVYGFVQETVSRTGDRPENNRYGLGGGWQVTPRLKTGAEISTGDGGVGGKLLGDYKIDDRSNVYATYTNETDRPDLQFRGRIGTLVLGSGYRLSDQVRIFDEVKAVNGAGPDSLVNTFGLDYSPTDRWTVGFKGEIGTISDPLAGDLKRKAGGLSLAYKFEKTKYASALEFRDESGTNGHRSTWLMKNALGLQLDPSWRLLTKFNFSFSEASQGAFYDANFMEFVMGAAVRPVRNDKFNALLKYTFFMNEPSPAQVSSGGLIVDYAQRSHVFSVDAIYDLFPWLSLGVKYGLRVGELRMPKVSETWYSSVADLMIGRIDLHIIKEWSGIAEVRRLTVYDAHDSRSGILVGLYRQITKNFKIGAGYNFTNFSDNLTDLSYRSRGVFINAIGAF
jgi:hypothetical protein